MEDVLVKYAPALKLSGLLWVSWPKETSSLYKGMGRDEVLQPVLENTPWVDVKTASIDPNWSGLKCVYKNKDS